MINIMISDLITYLHAYVETDITRFRHKHAFRAFDFGLDYNLHAFSRSLKDICSEYMCVYIYI